MPRYEVKFYIDTSSVLTPAEEAQVAHEVYYALRDALPQRIHKPADRKVYIRREYSPQEEREIVRKHAIVDAKAGRDWNTKLGCSCVLCKPYRDLGTMVNLTSEETR